MADFQNAGYRMLSFKYRPVEAKQDEEQAEGGEGEGANPKPADQELPSLSSLMTSLQEIQDASIAQKEPAFMRNKSSDRDMPSTATDARLLDTPLTLTEFHLFGNLPTELRLKIWNLSFLPRVVELRPTRPYYSSAHDDGRRPQWQSGCSNPAALSVSVEARESALEHFRIAFPLALITGPQWTPWSQIAAGSSSSPANANDGYVNGKGRLLRRMLHVSSEEDTVCLLGQDSDFARLSHVMRSFREADPKWLGIQRLGLSVRGWGYGGSAIMMKGLGRTLLGDLEQLVLFMYGEHRPPVEWREKGASTDGKRLEKFKKEGNRLELVPCEGSNALYAYRIWSGGKGRQFWDDDGNIMRVGRNEIQVMDLEFKHGW